MGNSIPKMPWAVTICTFIAAFAFYLTAGFQPLLLVFGAGILASYVSSARLEGATPLRWWVRLALLAVILAFNQTDPSVGEGVGNMRSRNIFAQFYLAEIMVQCWRNRPDDPHRSTLIALTIAGLLFLTASNTFQDEYIRYLTPVFILFFVYGLFRYRNRRSDSRLTLAWQAVAVLTTLVIGFISYRVIYAYKQPLTEFSNRFLMDRFPMMEVGMATQPILGEMFGLRGSAERVLRIENPSGNPHLRGMAFDFYYSGRWGPSFNDRPYRSALQGLAPEGADRILGAETVTITRLVGRNSLLYAPLETAAIDRGDAEDVEWSPDFGGPIRTRFRPPYEYILTIPPQENYQGLLATRLNPEQRKRALQIPERLDPRIAQLAQQITAQAKTPQAKIEAVISYLLANHRYSLYFRRSGGDPLEDFLLTEPKKDAHCEYFASAATILLRCVGVPSRYITGYYAHESAGENQVVVRQRDAHAWSEAWVEGVGWVTVEATPGDGRPDAQDQEIEWWRNLIEKIQDAWKAFTDWLGERTQEQINVTVSVFLLGGVLYGAFIYARKRRAISTIPGFAYSSASAHLAALVARFEAAFTKKGVPFPAHLTYSEHLDNLAKNTPEALQTGNWIDAGRRFIRYYDAARFGGQWDDATRNALETIVQELEQAEKSKPETQAS